MPRLLKQPNSVAGLTEQEKFVLSLVDGKTSLQEIARVTGFGLTSVNKILEKLSHDSVIEFAKQPSSEPGNKPEQPGQSIQELVALYDNADPYAILGVPENAGADQIKEAYFEKTKMFHPDSYYARSVPAGDKHLLETIYKKVQGAYETLKNSQPRQILKGPQVRSPEPPAATVRQTPAPLQPSTAKASAQHLISDQIKDRVKKAAAHYKIGMEAFMHNDYANAYLNLKLANSYNPYDQEYLHKMEEAEQLMKSDRYDELLKKADISIELDKPDDAIKYLKTAYGIARDKKLVCYKLASVLYDFNQSLKEAKNYCQQAIELNPKNPDYHHLLARIYQKAGLPKNALFEYEQSLNLGMKTDEIKIEIKQLKSMVKNNG